MSVRREIVQINPESTDYCSSYVTKVSKTCICVLYFGSQEIQDEPSQTVMIYFVLEYVLENSEVFIIDFFRGFCCSNLKVWVAILTDFINQTRYYCIL